MTCSFLVIGLWGSYCIRQEFDPILLLPRFSYLRQFIDRQRELTPRNGWSAQIYTGPIYDVENDMRQMEMISRKLEDMVGDDDILTGKF